MTSPATRIKYMTDGMLLREALVDSLLSKYQVGGGVLSHLCIHAEMRSISLANPA